MKPLRFMIDYFHLPFERLNIRGLSNWMVIKDKIFFSNHGFYVFFKDLEVIFFNGNDSL